VNDAIFGSALLATAGETATYTPPGGVPVATRALIEHTVRVRADDAIERLRIAHLPTADVPAPVRDALLTVADATYRVDALADADGATVAVTVRAL
jgi:hypothetical protein